MAIRQLIGFINNKNIAEDIDENELKLIAEDVIERFNQDKDSMKEWEDAVEFGQKLLKQELHGKSTPWEGAANFKSQILQEAGLAFGNRSVPILLGPKDLVRSDVIGNDKDGIKQARADRVTDFENFRVNHKMKEWRGDHKRLLYTIPNVGTMFKKTLFDPLLDRNISHVIHYPDFVVNQATTNIDTARSFTHILDISENKTVENVRAGIWLDLKKKAINPEDSDGDEGSNEKEEVVNADENPNRFFEQYCFVDLDDDGYEEPYIVTVHEMTRKVVRIVARYDQDSIIVEGDNGRPMTLQKATDERAIPDQMQAFAEQQQAAQQAQAQQQAAPQPGGAQIPQQPTASPLPTGPQGGTQQPEPDLSGLEVMRIEPDQPITKYGFIPSQDGTFLDLGYFHLIGAITMGVNATTNQLLNSGTLATQQGGFLAKNARKKMGDLRFRMGVFTSTELSPADLQGGIMQMPTKEPSATLMALNEKLDNQGRQFSQAADQQGVVNANTAPTTALALIQEQQIGLSALMGFQIDSMSSEFQKLFDLDRKNVDQQEYTQVIDDPQANFEQDFNSTDFDIVPTADAEMSSKMQRIQMAEVQMTQFERVQAVGGELRPLVKGFFEAIGSEITEQVFPDPETMTDDEKAAMDQQRQATEAQTAEIKRQNDLVQQQVQLLQQAEERKDREQQVKAQETQSSMQIKQQEADDKSDKNIVDIDKVLADTELAKEKAQTEDKKNSTNALISIAQEETKRIGIVEARKNRNT